MTTARSGPRDRITSDHASGKYLQVVIDELNAAYPHNRVVNIVCHGHSVPAGYFRTPEVRSLDSYPHLLHLQLKQRFPNAVVNVIVTAIGGESSDLGAARFHRDVLRHAPDLVTIDYALNDRRIGLETAREAWASMIRQAVAAKAKVLLLTPTWDGKSDLDRPDDILERHRNQIIELASEFGAGLVDSYAAFQQFVRSHGSVDRLMSAPNHPNRRGHELVVDELMKWF